MTPRAADPALTPAQWAVVKQVLHEMLALPAAERPVYLDHACAGDPAARSEIASLLAVAESEGRIEPSVLERSAAAALGMAIVDDGDPPFPPNGSRDVNSNRPEPPPELVAALAGEYVIECEVGRGGMAIVYRALEVRHQRPVALKVLRTDVAASLGAEMSVRFRREVLLVAPLQHPNIVAVHASGAAAGYLWFTMPYVEGESLQHRLDREGHLPIADAVQIAREAALALDYAHRHGVVHRDVKPANILLSDGHALVADFGIAKALDTAADGTDTATHLTTRSGAVLGTAAYMSPEQAAGERSLDARTDVYALGLVLYEMLVGKRPFAGATPQAVMARLAGGEPLLVRRVRAEVPAHVERAIRTALALVPDDRFQTAAAFAAALDTNARPTATATRSSAAPGGRAAHWSAWRRRPAANLAVLAGLAIALAFGAHLIGAWIAAGHPPAGGPPSAGAPSVAVLPFRELSGDHSNAQIADGLTDELTARLSRVPGLRVPARASALAFSGEAPDVRDVGRRLSVATVVEGTVRRAARRVRVTARLVDVATARDAWTGAYEVEAGDLVTVENTMAGAIVTAIYARLGTARPAAGPAAAHPGPASQVVPNADAYLLYLQGRHAWHQRNRAALLRAVDDFERALAIDPALAVAYAGLADTYAVLPIYAPLEANVEYDRAVDAARRALALDSTLAEPHATLGYVAMRRYAWADAEAELRRAIALDPNSATAHQYHGKALAAQGQLAEADAEFARALALDPLSAVLRYNQGQVLYLRGQYVAAAHLFREALQFDSAFSPAHVMLGFVAVAQGRHRDALPDFRRAFEQDPTLDNQTVLGYGYAVAGARATARRLLADVRTQATHARVSATDVALLYLALGQTDSTFAWLHGALAQHDSDLQAFIRAPVFAPIRRDPRFADLQRAMHL